jgi:hypothetical protein
MAAKKVLEARGGIEPPIKVLQTFALPLGDRATERKRLLVLSDPFSVRKEKRKYFCALTTSLLAPVKNSPVRMSYCFESRWGAACCAPTKSRRAD